MYVKSIVLIQNESITFEKQIETPCIKYELQFIYIISLHSTTTSFYIQNAFIIESLFIRFTKKIFKNN